MIDLNAMIVFAQVIEQGSFIGAARRLDLPKSTVTRRIQELEASLQVQLLERSTRVMRPTEIGQLYYDYCDRIATEIEEAEAAVQAQKSEPTGTLRISAPSAFTHLFLKSTFPKFLELYPKIRLVHEMQNQAINPLKDGFDVVIRVGVIEDSLLKIHPFGEVAIQLFASPEYLAKVGIPESINDLVNYDTIATGKSRNKTYTWKLYSSNKEQELIHTPRCVINDPISAYELVIAGIGIGLLPYFFCCEAVQAGQLVPLFTDWWSKPVLLSAIYPTGKARSPKVKVFLQFLDENLKDYQFKQKLLSTGQKLKKQ